jgi:hypothetical protein
MIGDSTPDMIVRVPKMLCYFSGSLSGKGNIIVIFIATFRHTFNSTLGRFEEGLFEDDRGNVCLLV